jgi:superfamily II DNA or RNA helicase
MSHFQSGKTKIPVEIMNKKVILSEEEFEECKKYEFTMMLATKKIGPIPNWVKYVNSDIDEVSMIAKAGIKAFGRERKLLNENEEKIKIIYNIIKKNKGQFIVFNDTKEGMYSISEYLNSNGITADVINADVSMGDRRRIISNIMNKNTKVLIGGNAISEGLDLPDISNVIFSSLLIKSTRLYVQRLGRVMRPVEGKQVKCYIVYCAGTIEERNREVIYKILGEKFEK